ncbi:MAG: hypothetical protein ACREUT_06660, partial [Steroidobacteraceae bacterium]
MYSIVDFDTLGGDVIPRGINDHDDVVGTTRLSPSVGGFHAFLYLRSCGCIHDLALTQAELSDARAVSDSDIVTMDSTQEIDDPDDPAIIWNGDNRAPLPGTNANNNQWASANAMNTAGLIAGDASTAAAMSHATLWTAIATGYVATDLGTLGGMFSHAAAINAAGDVAGTSDTDIPNSNCDIAGLGIDRTHAFLYKSGVLQDLGTLSTIIDNSEAT